MGDALEEESDGESTWIQRFSGTEPRLSEVVEMYEQLGYEVRVESVESPKSATDLCSGCAVNESDTHIVYTRESF